MNVFVQMKAWTAMGVVGGSEKLGSWFRLLSTQTWSGTCFSSLSTTHVPLHAAPQRPRCTQHEVERMGGMSTTASTASRRFRAG